MPDVCPNSLRVQVLSMSLNANSLRPRNFRAPGLVCLSNAQDAQDTTSYKPVRSCLFLGFIGLARGLIEHIPMPQWHGLHTPSYNMIHIPLLL